MEYSIGTKIPSMPGWEIIKELGEGSYGKVFEVHKKNYDVTAKAALKLIRIPKSVSDIREAMSEGMDEKSVTTYFEGIVKRFVKEIAIMSELKSHPNIVACEDYIVEPHAGEIGWDILIRMELLTPMVNYQLKTPMTEETVRRLAIDMCEALVFCQKKGLIHRDVKPANIFVDENGRFKLGDFGVARSAEKTMGGYSKQGTENYMAPEVYLGRPYGATVDIYSLGLVLYRLMNGNRLPFYPAAPKPIDFSDRENALVARMRGDMMPPPCNASEEFAAIILKACAYDSKDRYRTAAEMLEVLRCLDGGHQEYRSPESEPQKEEPEAAETEDEGSIGSIGFNFGEIRKEEDKPAVETEKVMDVQDEESVGSIGISWGKKETEDEQEDDGEPGVDTGDDKEEASNEPDVSKPPLSISKIALPPILFWISWMVLPIMMYITKSGYYLENPVACITAFAVNAAASGTLMYLSVTMAKKGALIMYGTCLGAALLCCVISVSIDSDFGMMAFVGIFVLIPAAALSMLLQYICKDKGARVAAAGVGAVIVFAAQLCIISFG